MKTIVVQIPKQHVFVTNIDKAHHFFGKNTFELPQYPSSLAVMFVNLFASESILDNNLVASHISS